MTTRGKRMGGLVKGEGGGVGEVDFDRQIEVVSLETSLRLVYIR
jgi:hypothetical protein